MSVTDHTCRGNELGIWTAGYTEDFIRMTVQLVHLRP